MLQHVIVLINCLEMLYIRVGLTRLSHFPYFTLRWRVTGQQRLYMIWELLDCDSFKNQEQRQDLIPRKFYRALNKKRGAQTP